MKDKSDTLRGACQSCTCAEYRLGNTNKCADCSCPASAHRQEDYGSNKSKHTSEEERSSHVINRSLFSAGIWLLFTIGFGYYAMHHRPELTKYNRGFSDSAYLLGATNVFMLWLVSFSATSSKNLERRTLGTLFTIITTVVVSTFLVSYFRLSPQVLDVHGYPTDLLRLVEWTRDCPALVLIIGYVTRARKELIARAELTAFLLMVFGSIGWVLPEPWAEINLIFSVCTHYMAVYDIYDMFEEAIQGKTNSPYDPISLGNARTVTMWAWNGFGVVFYLVRYGWIGFELGEALYIISEVAAKAVLAACLYGATVEASPEDNEELTGTAEPAHIKAY